MTRVSTRYVHKVAPSDKDLGPTVDLPDGAFSNGKTLGKALRDSKIMMKGARVQTFRPEGDKVIVFPSVPGLTTYWHSIILTIES